MTELEAATAPLAAASPDGTDPEAEFVLLGVPDVNGSIRGKALRPDAFETALRHGSVMTDLILGLDPVDTPIADYEGFGIRTGAADLVVRPEPETLHALSWRPGWRVCLATPSWPDGSPAFSSREVLRNALGDVAGLGYDVVSALEYEIRIWDEHGDPLSSGISYSLNEIGRFERFLEELVRALDGLGVVLSAVHTEAGPGLLELNLGHRSGLAAADDATFVKFAAKQVAASLGLRASFLAKTRPGEEGSSGHVHMSFWRGRANAFAGVEGTRLPPAFSSAVAGLLEHLPAASLLLNPTINSYKRLIPGWFAPINATWGVENRSCAVRAIPGARPELARFECRRPGADANPYLVVAALAASAADGIRREASPPEPIVGDAYARTDLPELPGSLESALRAFDEDPVLRRALGETFCDYFVTSRIWELKAWRETVTDWERERYDRAV
ncbi:MAG: glutamine synthetase family protein [Candidatus Velamenicoccus archaeovorus]